MMFLGLRTPGNICCGHKMFLNKIRNIFCLPDTNLCPQQMLRAWANGKTFVSATVCPQQCVLVCLTSQIEAPTYPRATPRAFEFLKNFVQIPLSPGRKAVQTPPPSGKLPDYCLNFSEASVMLLKQYMCKHGLLDNTRSYMPRDSGHQR